MRIGILTDGYRPGVNGVIRSIALHKRVLEELGHEVFVFTWGKEDLDDEAGVIRSPGLSFIDPGYHIGAGYSRRARSVLKTVDVLHANQPLLSGALALIYGRRYGLPVVFTGHSRYDILAATRVPLFPLPVYHAALTLYLRWFAEQCDLVTVASPVAAEVMEDLGVTSPIEVIPFGVELDRYRNVENRLTRSDLGLPASVPLALSVGRLAPEKNVGFLLEALAQSDLADAYLLVLGGGSERADLETLAGELGLDGRVCFVGKVPLAEVPTYAALADFFVTASKIEMLGIAVLEALAAGLPVVGFDMAWIRPAIQDGVNGMLTSPEVGAFARAWAALLEDDGLRARLAEGARVASERYDVRRTTAAMVAHYERLVKDGGRETAR